MKLISLIAVVIVFIFTIKAQEKLPIIKSNSSVISIFDGEAVNNSWVLNPELKPDVYEAKLIKGKSHKVTFSTDLDSISFEVEEGKKYDFIIQYNNQLCYQQIVGKTFVPAAEFDKEYQAKHNGKIFVEVPEVYELVNIAIALTPTGSIDQNLVFQKSDYYQKVCQWFDKYQSHPLISAFEDYLRKNLYFHLKVNSYAFEFDKNGKIANNKIYDRISGGRTNTLRPFLEQLQSFADQTNFREFYHKNRSLYQEQIGFYQNIANLGERKKWLDKHYSKSNSYNAYKVIFSPLVSTFQSSHRFESNGFKELQAHVYFPYSQDVPKQLNLSKEAEIIYRGNIAFTEINTGYININDEKIQNRILKATENRDYWLDKSRGANYYPHLNCFYEYMNWVLVNLRFIDYAPKAEQEKMMAEINRMMVQDRGFLQFEAFSNFVVDLYRQRQPNQTLTDLYPQIIEWFEKKKVFQK